MSKSPKTGDGRSTHSANFNIVNHWFNSAETRTSNLPHANTMLLYIAALRLVKKTPASAQRPHSSPPYNTQRDLRCVVSQNQESYCGFRNLGRMALSLCGTQSLHLDLAFLINLTANWSFSSTRLPRPPAVRRYDMQTAAPAHPVLPLHLRAVVHN